MTVRRKDSQPAVPAAKAKVERRQSQGAAPNGVERRQGDRRLGDRREQARGVPDRRVTARRNQDGFAAEVKPRVELKGEAQAEKTSARAFGFGGFDIPSPGDLLDDLKDKLTGAWNSLSSAVRHGIEGIADFAGLAKEKVAEAYNELKDIIKDVSKEALADFFEAHARNLSPEKLAAIQVLAGVTAKPRHLTAEEKRELRKVYGDSIDLDAVVIREGNIGLMNQDGRAVTLGNTILVPAESAPLPLEILVHEFAHVWQYQHGGTDYIAESVAGQLRDGHDAYNFSEELKQGTAWKDLGPEMQAALIQKAYEDGYFNKPGERFVVDGHDYTAYLKAALREMKAGRGAP